LPGPAYSKPRPGVIGGFLHYYRLSEMRDAVVALKLNEK
jgi:hypothetical protein